jgi:ElaB/YqjD/DUF883 family membrane-anchored ribosome-binding protein
METPMMRARSAVNGKFDKLQGELQALQGDVAKLIQEIPSMVTEMRDESLKVARDRVNRIQQHIDASLSQMTDQGRDAVRAIGDATGPVARELEEALHAHPFATIAIAIGVGWLLGASWKR